jgi:type IV pilus assembly protein PilA
VNYCKKKRGGFTLIEIIVVISIISILAFIAIPKFGNIQENAKQKADVATAKNIAMAINTELSKGKSPLKIDENMVKQYFNNEEIKQQALVDDTLPNKFSVYIKVDGEIFIFTGDRQVYPSLKDNTSTTEGKDIKSFEISCN